MTSNLNITCIAVSPDSLQVAAGTVRDEVRVWNITDGFGFVLNPALESAPGSCGCMTFSPNGRYLAVTIGDSIHLWMTNTWQRRIQLPKPSYSLKCFSIAFSPDSCHLAIGGSRDILTWKVDTEQQVHVLKGHAEPVTGLSFFPDGARLASSSKDRTIRVWNLDQAEKLQHTWKVGKFIDCCDLSLDGKILASGGHGKRGVVLRSAETGDQVVEPHEGHPEDITSVSFSPDGKHLASTSASVAYSDGKVHIIDVKSGCFIAQLRNNYRCVAYTPDGKYIVSVDSGQRNLVCVMMLTTPAPPRLTQSQEASTQSTATPTEPGVHTSTTSQAPAQDINLIHTLIQSQHTALQHLQQQVEDLRNQMSLLAASLTQAQGSPGGSQPTSASTPAIHSNPPAHTPSPVP